MQPKTRAILFWTVTILFSAFILVGAISELMQTESAQKGMVDLGYPIYLNYIIGLAKVLGIVALLQWRIPALREWAYAGFTIDIIGASASMYFAGLGIGMAIFVLVFLLPVFASYWLWKQSEPVLAQKKRS